MRSSGIDPSGQHVFTSPPPAAPRYLVEPGEMLPWENSQLIVTPARTVAPVGSDVALVASVRGRDQFLRTNERVEWTLSPGGVGQIVDFGRGTWWDVVLGDFTWPRKIDGTGAITSTSRQYLCLNHQTPTPTDDVYVQRGQTWVTVTSPVEGTSHVVAFAPSVYGWQERKQAAVIHWIDAEFRYPAPAISPAGGRHVLTTTVTRHTSHAACVGWVVRYQVCGGPAAGFGPQGAPVVEVLTNEAGQASVEIVQAQPASGCNRIQIQVFRPAGCDGAGRLAVGCGCTTATWSAPELSIRKSGPAAAAAGAQLTYRIDVTNPGDLPADDVEVTDEIPPGMEYLASSPKAEQAGPKLLWRLGRLSPRQTRGLQVQLRASGTGSFTTCAEATATGGLRTRDCVTTTVGTPALSIKTLGPSSVALGEEFQFEILVTNHGAVPATGLLIKDRFDEGLTHSAAQSPIEKDLADLAPGQTHRIAVTFRATKPGSLCHEIEVTGEAGVQATGRGCVRVMPGAVPPATPGATTTPGAAVPPAAPPAATRPAVSVTKTGPAQVEAGKTALFAIEVRNTGNVALTNVQVADSYDPELKATQASEGNRRFDDSLFWTIAMLAPGAVEKFEVLCECPKAVARTCNRVSVTTAEGAKAQHEACLSIVAPATAAPAGPAATGPAPAGPPAAGPAPAGPTVNPATGPVGEPKLAMRIIEFRDPARVNTPVTYEIRVSNEGATASAHDVTLVVTLPDGMSPVPTGTTGPAKCAITGQTIRFEPVAEFRANETPLSYRIYVNMVKPGKVTLQAQLTCREQVAPVTAQEETEILAQ